MLACENSRYIVANDFAEVNKIVKVGATSKSIKDLENILEMVLKEITQVRSPFSLRNALYCSPFIFAYAQQFSDWLTSCRLLAIRHPWRQPRIVG